MSYDLEGHSDEEFLNLQHALLPAEVHQASGMVSVQLRVPVDVALAHLYRYAAIRGLGLAEVARRVVARTLRFDHSEEDTAP